MDKKRFLKALFGRILTPSYISTILWLITDTVEVVVLGVALSVVLAVASPLLETGVEFLEELRIQRQATRRGALLAAFVGFMNAYKDVLTKYPAALFPCPLAHSMSDQVELLAQYFRTLKGLRTKHYPTPYNAVYSLEFAPEDFQDWDLQECADFAQQVLGELAGVAIAPLQQVVQHFVRYRTPQAWRGALTAAERKLDAAARRTLGQWRFVQQARADAEIRQRITTLLRSGEFHRQAGLQAYLTSRYLQYPPSEVHEAIIYLRHASVANLALDLIEGHTASAGL
jgi:hypothetical protein